MEDKKIAGAIVGDTKLNISHLFYADDVVFLTDWSHGEVDGILDVLHNFHVASGLKINISKSNIYGVGVNMDEVSNMARATGCAASTTPFIYLGIPVGIKHGYIKGVIKELEQLRARFFWGCQSDKKKIAWVAWDKVLASKDIGGLRIGSLASFNLALLQKWRWRFYNESEAMWCRVIKALKRRHRVELSGRWDHIQFWMDIWVEDQPLWSRFNRLYMLETEKICKVRDRWNDGGWVWKWRRDVRGGIEQNQLNTF
ncbi:RNA-directed DNA polymerase, eukaryota, reverse transcriptase zinc-binding domain protein [Tanacetum coccineum]